MLLDWEQPIGLRCALCAEGKNTGKTTSSTLKSIGIASVYSMIRIPLSRQIKNASLSLRGIFIFERSDVSADIAREIRRDKFLIEPE
jgi:hypothetical protein